MKRESENQPPHSLRVWAERESQTGEDPVPLLDHAAAELALLEELIPEARVPLLGSIDTLNTIHDQLPPHLRIEVLTALDAASAAPLELLLDGEPSEIALQILAEIQLPQLPEGVDENLPFTYLTHAVSLIQVLAMAGID